MKLKQFLNAYANRHGNVVIKDEFQRPIVSGDAWDFVINKSSAMKYKELHDREVYCFSFSDNTLYVCLSDASNMDSGVHYNKEV